MVTTPQLAQVTLVQAAIRAQVEMSPALDTTVMERVAKLPAARADPPAPTQAHRHDHLLGAEADIDNRRPGQTEHRLESGRDAHVVLLRKPLVLNNQQPAAVDGGASVAISQPAKETSAAKALPHGRRRTLFTPN